MSEAVANSPEAPPAPQKDADELIAQLAGKEVDRLLASADIEREEERAPVMRVDDGKTISSPADPLAADAAKTPGDDEAALAQQIEALITGDKDKAAHTMTEPASAPALVEVVAAPLSDESSATAVANAAIMQPPATVEPAAPVEAPSTENPQTIAVQSSPAPDAAPKIDDAAASEPQSQSVGVDPLEIPGDDNRRLPIYLLPLEWLNRPFTFLSDAVRDALGKIAVLTSLNAAALFAYVIWFRHR
ncbi:MAG TPA: hypothetical protein VH370_24430 [Humisphaera sp.]|jgi:hypothetical protein|nr:hypothetical protein [Humisphaera sp.]